MLRRTSFTATLLGYLILILSAADTSPVPARALNAITPEGILKHIRVLASDEFEGRAPATPGEQKSLDYIIAQCKALKLSPGQPDGTWLEPVSLWGIAGGGGEITVKSGGADFPLTAQDYRVTSQQPKASIEVAESPIVFVGYGIVAPEYKWDDYKDIDVKGKAMVILAGDPPVADPSDPSKLDPKMFLGPEISFYGRAGSKADLAFARGAAAVITLQGGGAAAGRAGSGRGVRRGGANSGPNRYITRETMSVRDASSTRHIAATVSLNSDKAAELFAGSGQDLATLRASALSPSFRPVALKATIAVKAKNEVREINSNNVVAKIEGSDRELRNEYVIYSGHWDHMRTQGENIFHGASDNASGVAGVLELARAFTALPSHPKRPMIFLFTTAEERGLLGARYYVQHPSYPLANTVANINLDYFSNWGWGRRETSASWAWVCLPWTIW